MIVGPRIIAVSGSRHWRSPDAAQAYVQRLVTRAIAQDHWLYVGDNPEGVDLWIVEACNTLGWRHRCVVFGRHDAPRNGGAGWYINERFKGSRIVPLESYGERDQYMIFLANMMIAIWNGKSPGTKAAHDFAISRHVETHLVELETPPADDHIPRQAALL